MSHFRKAAIKRLKHLATLSSNVFLMVFVGVVLIFAALAGFFYISYRDAVYPNVRAFGVNVGGMNRAILEEVIAEEARKLETKKFTVLKNNLSAETTAQEIGIAVDVSKTAEAAKNIGRSNPPWNNIISIIQNGVAGYDAPVYFTANRENVSGFIYDRLADKSEAPVSASVVYVNGIFAITPAQNGQGIDPVLFSQHVISYINDKNAGGSPLVITDNVTQKPDISDEEAASARNEANELLAANLELFAGDKKWSLSQDTLASFFSFKKVSHKDLAETGNLPANSFFEYRPNTISNIISKEEAAGYSLQLDFAEDKIKEYLGTIAPGIEQTAVNARLAFEENQLKIIDEGQDKVSLDMDASTKTLIDGIAAKRQPIELIVSREKAPVSRETLEQLGIKTLLAKGVSNFAGSPKNRRHNIAVGAAKFDGILIAPGEIFSFLTNLGPVDASTGYLPELVIKEDKTIPEFGGGMCQVSTTSFRGAVNAGLEVVERRNHAYPVQYYSPQGTDATVYIPSPDLKFKNNTPAHILIQTHIDGNTLTFDYYGTSDNRRVETEGPITYDRKGDGSMKAKWTQRVYSSDGNLLFEKVFLSKYDSPSKFPHPGEEPPKESSKKKKKH